MKVAFIGLGNMGSHMARHLMRAGHDVTVWNRTLSKAEELRAQGAKVAKSPGEAAKEAEAVITMLADDRGGRIGRTASRRSAGEPAAKCGPHFHEHHQRGAVEEAGGGARQARAEVHCRSGVWTGRRPRRQPSCSWWRRATRRRSSATGRLLEALGQRVFVMGDKPEMANVVKLSGNFLIASVIESLGEAIALTRKYGIDPHQYVDFLTNSLFAAPVYKTYGNLIADEKYQPAGFKMRLGLKDMKLALAAAESAGCAAARGQHDSRPHADRHRARHGRHGLERDRQTGSGERGAEVGTARTRQSTLML